MTRDGSRLHGHLCHLRRDYQIDAVIHDGKLYALNNRTLYAAKHFDVVGSPTWIRVTIVDKPDDWDHDSRFTTTTGGVAIEVRGGGAKDCRIQ